MSIYFHAMLCILSCLFGTSVSKQRFIPTWQARVPTAAMKTNSHRFRAVLDISSPSNWPQTLSELRWLPGRPGLSQGTRLNMNGTICHGGLPYSWDSYPTVLNIHCTTSCAIFSVRLETSFLLVAILQASKKLKQAELKGQYR